MTVHVATHGETIGDKESGGWEWVMDETNMAGGVVAKLGVAGVTLVWPQLVQTRETSNGWSVVRCYNCGHDMVAEGGEGGVVVNVVLDEEGVEKAKEADEYSSVFDVVLRYEDGEGGGIERARNVAEAEVLQKLVDVSAEKIAAERAESAARVAAFEAAEKAKLEAFVDAAKVDRALLWRRMCGMYSVGNEMANTTAGEGGRPSNLTAVAVSIASSPPNATYAMAVEASASPQSFTVASSARRRAGSKGSPVVHTLHHGESQSPADGQALRGRPAHNSLDEVVEDAGGMGALGRGGGAVKSPSRITKHKEVEEDEDEDEVFAFEEEEVDVFGGMDDVFGGMEMGVDGDGDGDGEEGSEDGDEDGSAPLGRHARMQGMEKDGGDGGGGLKPDSAAILGTSAPISIPGMSASRRARPMGESSDDQSAASSLATSPPTHPPVPDVDISVAGSLHDAYASAFAHGSYEDAMNSMTVGRPRHEVARSLI